MKRLILGFAAATVLSLVSPLLAQTHETTFRSTGSGLWTTSENWKYDASGIWLAPSDNTTFPGKDQFRKVHVVIDEGSSIRIPDGEVMHVSSLFVKEGELVVEGTLLVGYPGEEVADVSTPSEGREFHSSLVLEQNVPNPVGSGASTESTFRFYLDKDYAAVSLVLFDMMGKEIQALYEASSPSIGWHSVRMNVRNLPSGNYPVFLQVPGMPAERRLMTVVR
jgi:hypothetical protein